MKAIINSIVFASLAACTIAPAQAGVWDFTKKAAAASYEKAKTGTKATLNFFKQPKNICGLGLLTISALYAHDAIRHTKVDAIYHYVTQNLHWLPSVSQLNSPESLLKEDFARLLNHHHTPPLADNTKLLFVYAALFGIAGIYNISR